MRTYTVALTMALNKRGVCQVSPFPVLCVIKISSIIQTRRFYEMSFHQASSIVIPNTSPLYFFYTYKERKIYFPPLLPPSLSNICICVYKSLTLENRSRRKTFPFKGGCSFREFKRGCSIIHSPRL